MPCGDGGRDQGDASISQGTPRMAKDRQGSPANHQMLAERCGTGTAPPASEGTSPAHSLISDFWPPELRQQTGVEASWVMVSCYSGPPKTKRGGNTHSQPSGDILLLVTEGHSWINTQAPWRSTPSPIRSQRGESHLHILDQLPFLPPFSFPDLTYVSWDHVPDEQLAHESPSQGLLLRQAPACLDL